MATLRDLQTLVQREVMACPPFMIDTALNKGAREFLSIARYWRTDVPVNTAAGSGQVIVSPPSDLDGIEIISLKFTDTGKYLSDSTAQIIKQCRRTGLDRPQFFGSENGRTIELMPSPDTVYGLVAELAVRPALNVLTVDADVINKCGEGIALAAIADLRRQPGHPWSDPNRAMVDESDWRAAAWNIWHKTQGGFTGTAEMARPAFSWV